MTDAGAAGRKAQDQINSRVRASDAERERVAERLRAAVTEGRLTLTECDERLVELYAARYRDEMAPLTADLPGEPSGDRRHGWPGGRPRRPAPFGVWRMAVVLALIGVAVSAAGGRFFWPVIPLFFAVSMLVRMLAFRSWRRHWPR